MKKIVVMAAVLTLSLAPAAFAAAPAHQHSNWFSQAVTRALARMNRPRIDCVCVMHARPQPFVMQSRW